MASNYDESSIGPGDRAQDGKPVRSFPAVRGLWVVDHFVFVALLLIIALASIPYGSSEVWWEAAFESLIFALMGLGGIEGLARGTWGVSHRGMLAPLLLVATYAILQTIPFRDASSGWPTISADPYGTRLFALKLLALICVGLLLARFTSTQHRLRALIYLVILAALASALFGIVRETTHRNAPGFVLPQLKPGLGYGQFINRNHFAYLMEMALGLNLGLLFGKSEKRTRLLYVAAMLPIVLGLVLANSRGGILSMFSQVIFLLLAYGWIGAHGGRETGDETSESGLWQLAGKLPVRIILVVCLLGAMVIGVLWIGGEPLTRRLETIQGEVTSEDADTAEGGRRQEIWRANWKMIKDHPITGIGFGGYWVAITEYYDVPGQKRPYSAHNDYLDLLVSGGLVGTLLAIWFFIALLNRIRSTLQTRDAFRRSACLAALTGLFGIAVHSIVDFGLHIMAISLFTVVLIVIATIDERVEEDRARPLRAVGRSV